MVKGGDRRNDRGQFEQERSEQGQAAFVRLVRQGGQRRLGAPLLDEEPGHSRRHVRRASGDRHLQHLVRIQSLQRAFPGYRGAGETRRLRGRRHAGGVPGLFHLGKPAPADRDALSQPCLDGCRGSDSRPADGRRRAAGRLRQDHALADDGRGKLRSPHHHRLRRPDAKRPLSRRAGRQRYPCLEVLRDGPRRRDDAAGFHGCRAGRGPFRRPLHDHGYSLHDGFDGGIPRRRPAAQRGHPGRRFPSQCAVPDGRPPHRRDGTPRHQDVGRAEAREFRECHHGQRRHRRLDQCCCASAGHRRSHGHRHHAG